MFWGWNFRASLECIWCYQMSWIDRLWHSQNFTWARLLNVKSSQGNWNARFENFGWQSLACFRDWNVSGKALDVTTCLENFCLTGLSWRVFFAQNSNFSGKLLDVRTCLQNCLMLTRVLKLMVDRSRRVELWQVFNREHLHHCGKEFAKLKLSWKTRKH